MAVDRCLLEVSIMIAAPFLSLEGKFSPRYVLFAAKATVDDHAAFM